MKYLIHIHMPDGHPEDTVMVEGETIEEVQAQAAKEVAKRGGGNAWSEEMKP